MLAYATWLGPDNHCATSRPPVGAAHGAAPVWLVLADAEFDGERNYRHIKNVVGADSVLLAKPARPTGSSMSTEPDCF